ncbi:MAG: hypothetical protein HY898_19510 [Deltaproteobacteria bacterium]|nr:hypothetical protein [Deltaproteobacteria bacterium]
MRPRTLAEVASRALAGGSFDPCLASFLDEFYAARDSQMLAERPPLLAPTHGDVGQVQDAYLAATAEELARLNGDVPPAWVAEAGRALHRPYFASPFRSLRAVLLLESPASFRARNLFVSANALSRV